MSRLPQYDLNPFIGAFFYATLATILTTCAIMTANASMTELFKRAFSEMMKDVSTSVPGHILSFDPQTQLAQVQIGIVRVDVRGQSFTPPPLIEVPVYFAGGKWVVEYQIDPLDEGVLLFSQRCIDGWLTTGGVAENPIMRFHDMNDAFFLPGIRSLNNVVTDFANDGIRIRNADGSHYVWIKGDGTIVRTNGNGTDTMLPNGTVNINGVTIDPNGVVTLPNGVVLNTHVHTGNLGAPTSSPIS